MTAPGVNGCWCGCDKPLTGSEWWASEWCYSAWVASVDRPVPLPPEPPAPSPLHRPDYAARMAEVASQYTRAAETPPVEPTGWMKGAPPAGTERAEAPEGAYATHEGGSAPEQESTREFQRAYLDRVVSAGAEFQQVASENLQFELGQPGWLDRLITRLFGKGAA